MSHGGESDSTSAVSWALLILCIAFLSSYIAYMYIAVLFFDCESIRLAKNLENGVAWLMKHNERDDAGSVTLAIQTLRNTILVAIFIGGESFVFAYNVINSYSSDTSAWESTRVGIIATFLFLSFISWAGVIRLASHLGYYIGALSVRKKQMNENTADELEVEEHDDGLVDAKKMMKQMLLNFRYVCFSPVVPFSFPYLVTLCLVWAFDFCFPLFRFILPHSAKLH